MSTRATVTLVALEPCPGGCDHASFMGGDPSSPRWADYLALFDEAWQARLTAARDWLLTQSPIPCANEICNDYHLAFSDGAKLSLTWRAWGDFAQAAVDKREGYMAYYFRDSGEMEWRPPEVPLTTPTERT